MFLFCYVLSNNNPGIYFYLVNESKTDDDNIYYYYFNSCQTAPSCSIMDSVKFTETLQNNNAELIVKISSHFTVYKFLDVNATSYQKEAKVTDLIDSSSRKLNDECFL